MVILVSIAFPYQTTSVEANYGQDERIKDYDDRIVADMGNYNVMVDSRIELITILHYLKGNRYEYFLEDNLVNSYLSLFDSDYKKEIDEYFSPYKNHEAVLFVQEQYDQYFLNGFLQQIDYSLNLSPLPNSQFNHQQLNYFTFAKEEPEFENLNDFDQLLNDFAEDTNFMGFFQEHEDFYVKMINHTIMYLEDDSVSQIADYYGYTHNSYNLILSPLFYNGGASFWIESNMGQYDAYSVIGPFNNYDNKTSLYNDPFTLSYLINHEFSHSYVNSIAEDYDSEILRSYKLFLSMKDQMIDGYIYNSWDAVVNEHLIRSVTARLILEKYGIDEYNYTLQFERELGFIYIDLFVEQLEIYENNRDIYKTFDQFFPEIIKALDAEAGVE